MAPYSPHHKLSGRGQQIYTTATSKALAWYHGTKTFTMLGEVGMANKSTKTTQTNVWMAQHNE